MQMLSHTRCASALACATALAVVAGCSSMRNMGMGPSSSAPGSSMGSGASMSGPAATGQMSAADRAFAMQAAASGMYEVQVARLAASRASNPQVQQYAQMLVDHHSMANSELMAMARSRGMTPPTSLPADKAAKLNALSSQQGPQFDRQFVQMVGIQDHQADIALFENASRNANDPALKAWAGRTLPTLRSHLQAAQTLAGTMAG